MVAQAETWIAQDQELASIETGVSNMLFQSRVIHDQIVAQNVGCSCFMACACTVDMRVNIENVDRYGWRIGKEPASFGTFHSAIEKVSRHEKE